MRSEPMCKTMAVVRRRAVTYAVWTRRKDAPALPQRRASVGDAGPALRQRWGVAAGDMRPGGGGQKNKAARSVIVCKLTAPGPGRHTRSEPHPINQTNIICQSGFALGVATCVVYHTSPGPTKAGTSSTPDTDR